MNLMELVWVSGRPYIVISNFIEVKKVDKFLDVEKIEVDKLVKQYRTRRIKLGVVAGVGFTILTGGNLLKYFFRREIYSGIHGGY